MHPLTLALRSALAAVANPADAPAMQAYMKSAMPYYGVKTDLRRTICKPIYKAHPLKTYEEFRNVVMELWTEAAYREEKYCAIELCFRYKTFQTLEALPLYRMLIVTGAWWDYVDGIAADLVGGLLKRHPEVMKPEMCHWIDDPDIWIRRSALLSQLKFKKETDEAMFFEFCTSRLCEKDFWIRKAVGWVLREYSKTNREAVLEFIELHRAEMSGLTLREASKYV